ncbi:hypothetical protein SY88_04585 [Clostridiales bacterium PH28_bin88]|nr:hypothetical protein SY88_04585 [Clostridiales bacterium PH28_bin88]
MNFFISWAASKEVAMGWYIYLGVLLLLSLPLVFDLRLMKSRRKPLSIALAIGALSGFVVLSTTDIGLAWPTLVSVKGETTPGFIEGEKVFFKYGCTNCHQVGDYGIPAGPNLAGISARKGQDILGTLIRDYEAGNLHSIMPDYRQIMSPQELKLLMDFLKHL